MRVWEAATGRLISTFEGHQHIVTSVAWSPDSKSIVSGSEHMTVPVWEVETGRLIRPFKGHQHSVWSVAWSPDGKLIASGSDDDTIRIWETETGQCLMAWQSLHESHYFVDLIFGPAVPTAEVFGRTRLGDPDILIGALDPWCAGPAQAEEAVSIVTAKIVLAGESGVGKSALALRLAEDRFEQQVSTHGMRLWSLPPEQLSPAMAAPPGEKREVVIWDLGGQHEYRLVHQLFLHDTTMVLMLLDPTRDSHYVDIEEWNLRLQQRLRGRRSARLLIGAQSDLINPDLIDRTRIDALVAKWEMKPFCLTSAKDGGGIAELRDLIAESVDWDDLSRTSRPRLFQRIRDTIDELRRQGEVVTLYSDIESRIRQADPEEFDSGAVNTVVEQLARQGAITDTRLSTGQRAMVLQIGDVEIYAGSLVLIARENSRVRGVPAIELSEAIFRRSFPGIEEQDRLSPVRERVVLECVIELMIENGLCLKHERLLIFPTLFPSAPANDGEAAPYTVSLYYDFSGAIDNIYSSLVAQLAVSERFGRVRLWKDLAEFARTGQGVCGLRRYDRQGGWSHLDLLFSEQAMDETRDLFTVFVEEHLQKEGVTIREVLEME